MTRAATLPQDSQKAPERPLGTPESTNAHGPVARGEINAIERRRAGDRERQRRYRERKRRGLEPVRVEVDADLIDGMIARGLVPDSLEHDREAIARALVGLARESIETAPTERPDAELFVIQIGVDNEFLDKLVERGHITEAEVFDGDRIAEAIFRLALSRLLDGNR